MPEKTPKPAKPALSAANLAKVVKLIALAKEMHQQGGELLAEIDAILGGQASTAEKLRAVEQGFSAAWEGRYRSGYLWQYAKDRPNIKRLLRHLSPEDIVTRAGVYIRSQDGFYTRQRHPFGLFVSSINQWAPAGAEPGELLLEPVMDCRHDPACASDEEHTRRKMADMKAGS